MNETEKGQYGGGKKERRVKTHSCRVFEQRKNVLKQAWKGHVTLFKTKNT